MFVDNRKLTDNYRNFTFIRTYFVVVLQQHIVVVRQHRGVGEAPNTHYLIFITTSPILYLEHQQQERDLWGAKFLQGSLKRFLVNSTYVIVWILICTDSLLIKR